MDDVIPINLAVEDELSENVLREILKQSERNYYIGACYGRKGKDYLRVHCDAFNNMSKGSPVLLFTDLNKKECSPLLIREWFPYGKHNNLIFRIAVREVESWLLAHKNEFAKFLSVSTRLIPDNPDGLDKPKKTLLEIASKSRKRELREALIPARGSTATIGPDYNGTLSWFVQKNWDVKIAMENSSSLRRTYNTILTFQPIYKRSI